MGLFGTRTGSGLGPHCGRVNWIVRLVRSAIGWCGFIVAEEFFSVLVKADQDYNRRACQADEEHHFQYNQGKPDQSHEKIVAG